MLVSFQCMLHRNDLIYKTCYQQASKNSSSQKVPILFSEKFSMKCIFDAQQLRGLKNNCSKRIKAAIRRPSYLHEYCVLGRAKIVRDTYASFSIPPRLASTPLGSSFRRLCSKIACHETFSYLR